MSESRRRFQNQELIAATSFAFLVNEGQSPPRIVWRDVDEVRRLGSDGVLRLDRDLVIVQVRRQAGPRYAHWSPLFLQAVVDAVRD